MAGALRSPRKASETGKVILSPLGGLANRAKVRIRDFPRAMRNPLGNGGGRGEDGNGADSVASPILGLGTHHKSL